MAQGLKESESCNIIGWVVIALGLIAGILVIVAFGRIEVPSSYYGVRQVWSGTMISAGLGIIFNGFLVGYLFQKIGSILRYHENKKMN